MKSLKKDTECVNIKKKKTELRVGKISCFLLKVRLWWMQTSAVCYVKLHLLSDQTFQILKDFDRMVCR